MLKKDLLVLLFVCLFGIGYVNSSIGAPNNGPQNLSLSSESNNNLNNQLENATQQNINEIMPPIPDSFYKNIENEQFQNEQLKPENPESINSKNYYLNYPTIMFTKKNIDDIFHALNMTRQKTLLPFMQEYGTDDAIGQGNTQIINETNISIFLNSIMYISPKSWAVWINGNKITNNTNGDGEISVINISPLKVDFVWTLDLTRWELINSSKVIPESQYKIDTNSVNLYFSLSPNQTYIPITNKIIEGNIKPETATEATDTNVSNANNNSTSNARTNQVTDEQLESSDDLFF